MLKKNFSMLKAFLDLKKIAQAMVWDFELSSNLLEIFFKWAIPSLFSFLSIQLTVNNLQYKFRR